MAVVGGLEFIDKSGLETDRHAQQLLAAIPQDLKRLRYLSIGIYER